MGFAKHYDLHLQNTVQACTPRPETRTLGETMATKVVRVDFNGESYVLKIAKVLNKCTYCQNSYTICTRHKRKKAQDCDCRRYRQARMDILNEINVLKRIHNLPGPMQGRFQVYLDDFHTRSSYGDFYSVTTRFAGPDLHTVCYKKRLPAKITQEEWVRHYKELEGGILFLHSNNIAHRDIKPENIAQDPRTGGWRIIDFGLALDYDNYDPETTMHPIRRPGTFEYRAPLLTSRVLFEGATDLALLKGHLDVRFADHFAAAMVMCKVMGVEIAYSEDYDDHTRPMYIDIGTIYTFYLAVKEDISLRNKRIKPLKMETVSARRSKWPKMLHDGCEPETRLLLLSVFRVLLLNCAFPIAKDGEPDLPMQPSLETLQYIYERKEHTVRIGGHIVLESSAFDMKAINALSRGIPP